MSDSWVIYCDNNRLDYLSWRLVYVNELNDLMINWCYDYSWLMIVLYYDYFYLYWWMYWFRLDVYYYFWLSIWSFSDLIILYLSNNLLLNYYLHWDSLY